MVSATQPNLSADLESIVLGIHHRNRGALAKLDFSLPLLAPVLGLDSLDLAEIVVEIERRFGVFPMEGPRPPRTWLELLRLLQDALAQADNPADGPAAAPAAPA